MSDGLAYLLARAGLVEDRIRTLVSHRRQEDPAPDDPFRGLYLTDDVIDRLLADHRHSGPGDDASVGTAFRTATAPAARSEDDPGGSSRLYRLAAAAELSELDVELLLIALLPDLDSRFERFYGYLNDDVTRRRATVGLALELAQVEPAAAAARGRFAPDAPLRRRGLVLVEDAERPFLTRSLRVPDRVAAHLLGDDRSDANLAPLRTEVARLDGELADGIARALRAGVDLIHLRERVAGTGAGVGASALAGLGRRVLSIDLRRLAAEPDPAGAVDVVAAEALLTGSGVVAGPVEILAESAPAALRRLVDLARPVVLVGTHIWDPAWTDEVPLSVPVAAPSAETRSGLWHQELRPEMGHIDPAATAHFVLGPLQISRAVRAAGAVAAFGGNPATAADLVVGARSQNAAGLERLARRITPEVGWDDLVLPAGVLRQLHELADRARHRDQVLTEWRMRPGGGRGSGITALFAGDSGTGKTMSAEIIAAQLGLDLYTVNLATVVDKYIGETEKNLERIFTEASGVNAVLLFDEADAIFGKRSEVRDAHDRYANIESAYLLQRMETFDGLAILATNLRSNIDDAFTRRLDSIVDFPSPTESQRLELWRRCLAPPVPLHDDVDLAFCARSFTLSGGNIRSIAITAAYRAAAAGTAITMADLVTAIQQEYRKLGRLVLAQEFGPYLALSTTQRPN